MLYLRKIPFGYREKEASGLTMKITVQDVIDKLMEPVGQLKETVDILQFGDPRQEATGIAHRVHADAARAGAGAGARSESRDRP